MEYTSNSNRIIDLKSSPRSAKARLRERAVEWILLLSATFSILAIALIILFVFSKGLPLIARVGVFKFLFSTTWDPTRGQFGIATMIAGSLAVLRAAGFRWTWRTP